MDKYEKRRLALLRLIGRFGHGGIAKVAKKIGKDPNYVSRMLYPAEKPGRKRIGEDSVDALNEKFPGWIDGLGDIDHSASEVETQQASLPLWPFQTISEAKVRALQGDDLARLEGAWAVTAMHIGIDVRQTRQSQAQQITNPPDSGGTSYRNVHKPGNLPDGDRGKDIVDRIGGSVRFKKDRLSK